MSVLQTLAANTQKQRKLTEEVASYLAGLRGYLRTTQLYSSEVTKLTDSKDAFTYIKFDYFPANEIPAGVWPSEHIPGLLSYDLRFTNLQVRSLRDSTKIADGLIQSLAAGVDRAVYTLVGGNTEDPEPAGTVVLYFHSEVGDLFQDTVTGEAFFDYKVRIHAELSCHNFLNRFTHHV